eukprot:1159911-Pelagomonas_calceolata.AAC.4
MVEWQAWKRNITHKHTGGHNRLRHLIRGGGGATQGRNCSSSAHTQRVQCGIQKQQSHGGREQMHSPDNCAALA